MKEFEAINILGKFLGRRDFPELSQESLLTSQGIHQADIFVLFGGSILAGTDILATAIQNKVAQHFAIVGGAGHTTTALREQAGFAQTTATEAEIFQALLKREYGLEVDLLESRSTNCGNNISYLLDLLKAEQIEFNSIILAQDATMQLRVAATLELFGPIADLKILNYATYQVELNEGLQFIKQPPRGMWELERYINLLMGEIPRLRDDAAGYGPAGKGFLAHVDIPAEVETAFEALQNAHAVRVANPAYKSIIN